MHDKYLKLVIISFIVGTTGNDNNNTSLELDMSIMSI